VKDALQMNLSANATGSNGAAAGANTAGNAGGDGILYNEPLEIVTVPGAYVVTGGTGSAGGADVADTGGSAGGTGGDGVNFSGQNGTALTAGNFTGLVNDSVITGGNGGNGSASGAATSGHVSGGNGGYGGNGVTAYANFSEISGTGTVTGGTGGTAGDTGGDTGGIGGFGGDGIVISNNNAQLNSMGAIVGGNGGNGGIGNGALSGYGGYGGAAAGSVGQAGMAGDGGYGIDIDALGTDATATIGATATILGGSIGVNGAPGSGIAAIDGAVDGVGIGVEGTGGTITNNGTVEGGSAGAGVATGIYASTTLLTNAGHVIATSGDAVRVEDYFNYGAVMLSTLANTGTISATTGNAVKIAGDQGGGHIGTLTNSGTISATSGNAILIDDAGGGGATIGTLTNTGIISATSGVALDIVNGGVLTTLNNSGTIQGAIVLGSTGTFNNAGASTLSGGASTAGAINNTGTITIDSGETFTTTDASGRGTYTFQLTPGSAPLNGTEGQLISGTTNLTGATIQVAPAAGSFVNDSLFEIVAGTGVAVTGVTATPTDVGATHGDTATYKFYDVLGGTTLSSAFGGAIVPGNADDVFIIAVNQDTTTIPPPTINNSGNFNLTDWDLTLPVNSSGGTTGTAATVSNLANFTSPYFYDNADGSMTFNAPVVGATTNSTFGAGSGLNELNSAGAPAGWNLATGGTMSATLEVNSVPALTTGGEGSVIIGQVMVQNSNIALIQLYYDAGNIYFRNTLYSGEQDTYQFTDAAGNTPSIGLNQKFSYMINAQGSTLTAEVIINGDTYTSVTQIDSSWQSLPLYFKAGVYDGDVGTAGTSLPQATGAGQATFYGLDMSHTAGDGLGGLTAPVNASTTTTTYSPPVAHTETYTGTENQLITGNMLTTDTDPNGLALSITPATLTTAHGAVVENANGTFTYTPATNFAGTDTFNYTAEDTAGLSSTGTVNITVTAPSTTPSTTPSTAPVAETADFTSSESDPMFGNVLINNGNGADTDPNGSWLSIAAATLKTAHGASVTETSDGTITYIPAANFVGTDTFTYTLKDGAGHTSTGMVDVTVEPISTTGVVTFGPGSNMLFGAADDTFVFKAANLGTGVDTIRNFSVAENNKIDISDVLSGHYNSATEALSNFVNIVTSGSNSIVEVDLTGHAGASGWSQVATLFGVTGLNEQSLVQHGNLIV
jgi:hypothetical protein